jgi:aldehyde dehydrogenase (NAD+)
MKTCRFALESHNPNPLNGTLALVYLELVMVPPLLVAFVFVLESESTLKPEAVMAKVAFGVVVLISAILAAYRTLRIGDPLDERHHVGPLIDRSAVEAMRNALETGTKEGAKVLYGGEILEGPGFESGCYVRPAIVEAAQTMEIVLEETFAPILYLIRYHGDVSSAITLQNQVDQGLSSAIFSTDMRETEQFLSAWGSDCGIANANIGTSGAEIGGAFGGEKETGGGRESGSDAWKAYMRRQTNTINFGTVVPLAQGIKFDL